MGGEYVTRSLMSSFSCNSNTKVLPQQKLNGSYKCSDFSF